MAVIRSFNFKSDYENALSLWQSCGNDLGVGPSDQPGEILKKVARDPDLFLVAYDSNILIGTVIGGFDGRRGMVYHLAVAREYRQKGLGNQLMTELEAKFSMKGCRKVYLLVKNGNSLAAAFYEKRGWYAMNDVQLYGKNL